MAPVARLSRGVDEPEGTSAELCTWLECGGAPALKGFELDAGAFDVLAALSTLWLSDSGDRLCGDLPPDCVLLYLPRLTDHRVVALGTTVALFSTLPLCARGAL